MSIEDIENSGETVVEAPEEEEGQEESIVKIQEYTPISDKDQKAFEEYEREVKKQRREDKKSDP